MTVEGVEITHPDKVLFPHAGITKGHMVEYYQNVAPQMLPYLKDRPLSLQRFPDGVEAEGFYQKNASDHFPDFIRKVRIPTKEGENLQVYCNSVKELVYLANQGTISFHTWLSKRDILEKPDKVVFDLDPPDGQFEQVKEAAHLIRDFLKDKVDELHLMTTGQSGLHLFYYKKRYHKFDKVRELAHEYANELAAQHPDLLTTETRIDDRKGRIFVDYLRNAYAQTSVCPYSLRPNKHGGIATPINWEELDQLKSADAYNLEQRF